MLKNLINKDTYGILFISCIFIVALLTGQIDSTEMVIVYVLETIIIGLIHAIKLLLAGYAQNKMPETVGRTLFFLVHYGFFIFVQSTFFFVFLSMNDDRISDSFGLQNFVTVLKLQGVQSALFFLSFTHLFFFVKNYVLTKRYETIDIQLYMFQPYLRIFIQQFLAILPGFFIIIGQTGIVLGILLVLFRGASDLLLANLKNNPTFFNKVVDYLYKSSNKEKETAPRETIENYLTMVAEN